MSTNAQLPKVPFLPSQQELDRPFGKYDEASFQNPSKVYHPETWFHYIGGNVSKEGITRDLEAIAKAGISGIQLFHGQFGGPWPGVEPQITSLSANWDDAVRHTALECRRLGLRFSMNNCPGWATSGGPWITPANAMRNLIWNRTDVVGGKLINQALPLPEPSSEQWRDYKDITVLAFPTPAGDTGKPLIPQLINTNTSFKWDPYFAGTAKEAIHLSPATPDKPNWVEVSFPNAVTLRSVEFSSVRAFNHGQSYEPGVTITIQGVLANGKTKDILRAEMPQANWQDDRTITFACSELAGVKKYRISISNKYDMALTSLRLFSAARKNSWESEAAWTLRSIERVGQNPKQSPEAFIKPGQILDISDKMATDGKLNWLAPKGNWTILRLGHVNSGKQNGPAPAEGTGWEANKFAKSGAEAHFAGYIGRLSGSNGPLAGGLLNGMLIDSWECHTQSWTPAMEQEFKRVSSYQLRKWLPALFGYVIKDQETTARFLTDWRKTLNDLLVNNYYGRMASLAKGNGLSVAYETGPGDVVPADIMEYFKFADIPMCEFWQPMTDGFVGSINFKPIKPTASAARMYGKPRVAAESFTNMSLSWDEHFDMLKEVANINSIQGVSHFVFHTYTHNPQTPFLPPGSSFGAGIGTPFLRGQTWWKYMPEFTDYLSRCTYLLERGKPVSDVLWYLGDEINHKPNQNAPFPEGFKYDYCNPDVLLNRLKTQNGMIVTPEGIQYRVLWLPDVPHMLPQTLEKILLLLRNGATIVGEAPVGLATLSGGDVATQRFNAAVKSIWGESRKGLRKVGKGYVVSGLTIEQALATLKIKPDVTGGDALWAHRRTNGADWYFVTAPKGKGFTGELSFRASGQVELWDPVTGKSSAAESRQNGERTTVKLDLAKGGSCFIVFRQKESLNAATAFKANTVVGTIPISDSWKLTFPAGWGVPEAVELTALKPWKDLDISAEGKAFSGTATYTNTFNIDRIEPGQEYILDLGKVDMAASVTINGQQIGKLWAPPYRIDLKDFIKPGKNTVSVEVTSTWFNRLVFDAGQPEDKRKTWTISGPGKDEPLRVSGLLGPVKIDLQKEE
ncbi:Glycosyl hydrolases family 2, sugar binding domain [Mucilaginibacter pineti]|uniref:Glycosyl hydrolases family 2, sugar binding domain n=1 Tax=Mucilaginibacter pineti TaxID=1391627 RepID=A0A1G7M345_9SPHI|nr:glycosyl hydrolase [Mucilaginibacter pineti]SDF56036.1 Glycosyl hydrolases family 2, sugar binding domain [Mucilaginibacter pineti]